VARIETGEVRAVFSWEDLMGRNNLENLSVDGTIILKWIFKKVGWNMEWIDLD
jgi:hypothetical protein